MDDTAMTKVQDDGPQNVDTTQNGNLTEVGNNDSTSNGFVEKSENDEINTHEVDVKYSIYDTPPFFLCILLGLQHMLASFGAVISMPLLILPFLCTDDPSVLFLLISTTLFVNGLITILQSTIGTRLPIIQGGTSSFLVTAFAILSLDEWKCPPIVDDESLNTTTVSTAEVTDSELWKPRLREVQGAIILASILEIIIGFTGAIGLLLNYIGPLTIAPIITLIGFSLLPVVANMMAQNWTVALCTVALVLLLSQYLSGCAIPCPKYKKGQGVGCSGYQVFRLFPIILAIVIAWGMCAIFTITDVFPDDPKHWAYSGRTDTRSYIISEASWFRVPYPAQFGMPTFSVEAVCGMIAGVIAGMLESIGDYYACARLSGAPPPPSHAINRGIFIEGIGCVLAGWFGTGTGTTSHSENIGVIGISKVGSRRVVQFSGIIMIILATIGKFSAIFVTIPQAIIGGVLIGVYGMVAAVGISNLQYVNMNSSRNLFVFGFSVFFAIAVQSYVSANNEVIDTGNRTVDQIIIVLLSASMFIGGITGFILDNTIPGTTRERGLHVWKRKATELTDDSDLHCYEFPFGMNLIRKITCLKYLPISPTFEGFLTKSKHKSSSV